MFEGFETTPQKISKELPLNKLQFADNTAELTALAQAGFTFSGTPPRRVDMNLHNKIAFLFDTQLRLKFYIGRNLLSSLACGVYDHTTDIYIDFLKKENEYNVYGETLTRYHELGHAYIQRQNPNITKFRENMNEKMFGRKYPKYLSEKHWRKISEDQKKQYIALATASEGIAHYIAFEA